MNQKTSLKTFKNILCLCMTLVMLLPSHVIAFAAEVNDVPTVAVENSKYSPRAAFAINSKDIMSFDTQYLTEETKINQSTMPVINIDGAVYVPIQALADALGYTFHYNAEKKSIVVSYKENTVEFLSIGGYGDLANEKVYFALNDVAYTKIENMAVLGNFAIAQSDGVYLLCNSLLQSSNLENSIWSNIFTVEATQITISPQIITTMKQNITPPTENYVETIQKNYGAAATVETVAPTYPQLTEQPTTPQQAIAYQPVVNPYVPYSYPQMVADAQKLQAMFPEYIRTSVVGKSVEGRDIIAIELGNGPKNVFVCGSTHAREYISTTYVMMFVEKTALATRDGFNPTVYDVNTILKDVTFRIIPMINPDGVNLVQNGIDSVSPEFREQVKSMPINNGTKYGYHAWKANIHGVDLNRNYPINWNPDKEKETHTSPSSSDYPGPSPASEPEVQAVINYLNKYNPCAVVAAHTQGEIIYWSNPENQLGTINKKIIASTGFKQGRTEDDGYLSNFVRGQFNVYEITLELCKYVGPYPYPDENFDAVWNKAKDVCLIIADEISRY